MSRGLFDPPAAYEPSDAELAAPVPPVRAVLFDFSNTLFRMIDLDLWLRRIADATGRDGELAGDELEAVARRLSSTYLEPEVAEAQVGRDLSPERHRAAMRAWWSRVDFLRGHEEAAYEALRAPDAWVPYSDTGPVLRELHQRGIGVGVVSDFAWDPRVHLKHFDLDHLVDACVVSCFAGAEKPAPELFRTACERLGADPRAALMVGDSPARDGAAVAAGLRAYLLPAERRTGERGLAHVLGFLPEHQ